MTNGLGFSPDRKLLYHCDTSTEAVWVYDVLPDRTVKDRRIFAKVEGWPDGMAVDAEGGIFVAMAHGGEVVRIKSDGTIDRRIKIPQSFVTSVTFGGPDLQDLYVVTARDKVAMGTVYRMRSDIPGLPGPQDALSVSNRETLERCDVKSQRKRLYNFKVTQKRTSSNDKRQGRAISARIDAGEAWRGGGRDSPTPHG